MSNFTVTFSSVSFSLLFILSLLQNCFSVIQALIPSQQQGTYYTQPLYAAPPHVIHHTTVVQPNGMPAAMYAPSIPPPRHNGVTMGMVAGTTMAMSAGEDWFPFLLVSCFVGTPNLKLYLRDIWRLSAFSCPKLLFLNQPNKNPASVDLE